MSLPETIRISFGTAIALGLREARQEVPPTTAYLLWDPGCQGSCSYCPRAGGNAATDRLARVAWPEVPFDEVVARLSRAPGPLRRICLQTGWNDHAPELLPDFIASLRGTGLPVSLTLHPAQVGLAGVLLSLGLEHVGIGLDAASPGTYAVHKNRPWETDWPNLLALLDQMGRRIEVHLIFGLGDTERQFAETIEAILSRNGLVAMFALTPSVRGRSGSTQETRSVGRPAPPSLGAWRRMQVFRFLREAGQVRLERCGFSPAGELSGFGIPAAQLVPLLADGRAFQTSGCPDCNRPYYNERPGGVMYNYPRPLHAEEVRQAIIDLGLTAA